MARALCPGVRADRLSRRHLGLPPRWGLHLTLLEASMQFFQRSCFTLRNVLALTALVPMLVGMAGCNDSSSTARTAPPTALEQSAVAFIAHSQLPGVAVLVVDKGNIDVAVAGKRDVS